MPSSYHDESGDEVESGDDGEACAVCCSYIRQRDEEIKKKKSAENGLANETELREASDWVASSLQKKYDALKKVNKEYVSTISEVVEKMFYCKKDEGNSSLKVTKKVYFHTIPKVCQYSYRHLTLLFPKLCGRPFSSKQVPRHH